MLTTRPSHAFIPIGLLCSAVALPALSAADFSVSMRQITSGPSNHFFGYIGHVQNIPWNGDGRYIVALRTTFQDRMPGPEDPADVVLIDTRNDYAVRVVDQSRGWNPQQGTMFYWNPDAPNTQFFFNDRDRITGKVFCVLYDIEAGKRLREYRDATQPVGNGGVAQNGGHFLGINYARMARLRPVTGYKGSWDWTEGVAHPKDDGVFKIDIETGAKTLLVSFDKIARELEKLNPNVNIPSLFINHTLWNRDGDRIFFFGRGNFSGRGKPRINQAFVMDADGSNLVPLKQHIGGHPEWEFGHRMIGRLEEHQIIYDTDSQQQVGILGNPQIFPSPEGDIALSPDGKWFVNGHKDRERKQNFYTVLRRTDGQHVRSPGFQIGDWLSGDLRQDPSPCWNRDSNQILVPGLDPTDGSRQLFLLTINNP